MAALCEGSSRTVAYDPERRDEGSVLRSIPPPPWQASLAGYRPRCLATLLYDPLSGYHPIEFGPLRRRGLREALRGHGFPPRPNYWVGSPDGPLRIAVFRRGEALSSEFLILMTNPENPEGLPNGVLLPYSYALLMLLESLLPVLGGCPYPAHEDESETLPRGRDPDDDVS
jgi:hypothetical protein